MRERVQHLIDGARRDVVMLYLAARDSRVPMAAKMLALAVGAYALSPIDLIPDFIPVLGLLDEAVIIPIAVWAIARMIPVELMEDLRVRASARVEPVSKSTAGLVIVVSLWLLIAAAIWLAVVAAHE